MLATALATYFALSQQDNSSALLSPPVVALLLIANLVPAIALLVLLGRRVAMRRAARSAIGSDGQLHVRLVAIFSLIASIPMLMVVIFASVLFQYGVQFWFSDSARAMLQNAGNFARGYYEQNLREVGDETLTMASDLRDYLNQSRVSSPEFAEGYIYQVVTRKLNRSAIIEIGPDGIARTAATVDPDRRPVAQLLTRDIVKRLTRGEGVVVSAEPDQIQAFTLMYPDRQIYLYATRDSDAPAFSQVKRAQAVLANYESFARQSRALQIRFNSALFIGSLGLIGIAVWIALKVADRLVKPVNELVSAARLVAAGDLSVRVPGPHARDEIGVLASAFNRMTQRLEGQTGALMAANSQLENRRAFIEAILSGVSAGVLAVSQDRHVRMLNDSARQILATREGELTEHPLREISPDLDDLLLDGASAEIVQIRAGADLRTLAVKIVKDQSGHVLTFDDITQQLSDQRRAAWSDVARRIAHEIKNPLTPIQLAAERLQRRYAEQISNDRPTFTRLTETIVRQVGDLRRIVDEFSAFARMPKPVFRAETLADIARHSLFLHEVAHPAIQFSFVNEVDDDTLVCDRRQIGQALTNIVKNAVEAVDARRQTAPEPPGAISMTIRPSDARIAIEVRDNGTGLPPERERIIEPYMTTRAKGTGLGLAIVNRIVQEHGGVMQFEDVAGGGALVRILLDPEHLGRLEDNLADTAAIKGDTVAHGA
ncbi:MAG: HAMP domain-containing protein [Sphingobium sp.]|nr:HAMP domain-containing protein [Sphingobium sp.]MBP6112367.1 HAMP domain-containing protein [Sphingobium sp.]MBP8671816.1 HAMP domain-containing protein [Sphingobium sp.]MBP9156163.1 HAMP domain-containing protein [Sphingobium sp.]MCC6481835.1 HAMP domain-containing protein [Sphingomonadaceae bacterium]